MGILLVGALAGLVMGCTSVKITRSTGGDVAVDASSFMSSVDGLQASVTDQNGFTTTWAIQKGGVDQSISTLAAGLVDVTKVVAPLMLARQPTNSVATTNAAAKPAP